MKEMGKKIKDKEILDYYNGRDDLLLETAKNNYNQGKKDTLNKINNLLEKELKNKTNPNLIRVFCLKLKEELNK